MRICTALLLILVLLGPVSAEPMATSGRYLERDVYLSTVFPAVVPDAKTLWVTGSLREKVERVLDHKLTALRVRYWIDGGKSVWVLDEIGKELPITIGVTVVDGAIDNVRVLEFRESRGWEVKYPFFADQFVDARLNSEERLTRHIDGITGATLSVRAVTRVARVALSLHEHISE